jgi:hypothetical protein
MARKWLIGSVSCVLLLAACGVDPGDLAAYERREVLERVSIGESAREAITFLTSRGYLCSPGSGDFVDEKGATHRAPAFNSCEGAVSLEDCTVRTRVVVVPDGELISEVWFNGGRRCDAI